MGRLRSHIADQLLHHLEPPDHHETLIRLREMDEMRKAGETAKVAT